MAAEENDFGNDPREIYDLLIGYWKSGILKAAVELDVFSRIAAGTNTVEQLAGNCGVKERGMHVLLDSLCGLHLLGQEAGRYTLGPLAQRFLVKGEPSYIGSAIHAFVLPEDWEVMGRIEQAIREGGPLLRGGTREEQSWEKTAMGLVPLGMHVGQIMCDLLGIDEQGEQGGRRVLDIACGSGVYGYSLLQRDRTATVTDFDLKSVLNTVAAKVAHEMGVADRVLYRPGDIEAPDFGRDAFDIAIISHILQGYGPTSIQGILEKICEALVPGGVLVIHEFVPDEERSAKSLPLLFAVFMFVVTAGGGTYTFSEYSKWLSEAGFENPKLHDLPTQTSLIMAQKKKQP